MQDCILPFKDVGKVLGENMSVTALNSQLWCKIHYSIANAPHFLSLRLTVIRLSLHTYPTPCLTSWHGNSQQGLLFILTPVYWKRT